MKRVLFVIESLAGGGAERILCTLVKNLDRSRFDVTVLTVVRTGVYLSEVEKYAKVIHMLPDPARLTGLKKILYKKDYHNIYHAPIEKVYKAYMKDQYDVEVAFVEGFATKLVAASSNPDSKKYCWLHTDMQRNPYADRFYQSLEDQRNTYLKYHRIFAVSQSLRDSFAEKFGIESAQVVYNPVDSSEIIMKAKSEAVFREKHDVKLVALGRMEYQKGYDRLLKAVEEIREKNYRYHIYIIGKGSLETQMKQYAAEHALSDWVCFMGYQSNPYPYLAAADALICSSRAEGFSTVATEAIILGIPVFTTNCSGMEELFGNENCGRIVPNTQEAITEMLEQLVDGHADFSQYEIGLKKRAVELSLRKRMDEIEALLDE